MDPTPTVSDPKTEPRDGIEVSVVVPVYNSKSTLETLLTGLRETFHGLGRSYEVVLVDDGSRDGSWEEIQRLHRSGHPIRAFRFMHNHGQHHALKCALDHSVGRFVVTMDDDLQHPPEEIPKLLEALEARDDLDVVIGRFEKKEHSLFRNFGTWVHRLMRRHLLGVRLDIELTSFRILRRQVVDYIAQTRHANPRIGLIVLEITDRVANVPVRHEPRAVGRSGYSLGRMIANTWDNVVNYSSRPLKLVGIMGFLACAISLGLAAFYLVRYFSGHISFPGFATTILLTLFTSGAILLALGIIGEYLRRLIAQQLMHSQYLIRSELPLETHDESDAEAS